MKLKEKETKKTLSVNELRAELRSAEQKRFQLQFKNSVTPIKNAIELRTLRRQIARLRTWVREKELSR